MTDLEPAWGGVIQNEWSEGLCPVTRQQKLDDYEGFVEKFKPKKTTDDCYTPPDIYEVVADYVSKRWGIDRERMVRPFYPRGDYEAFDYPQGSVVVDNPPFSILSKICAFYLDNRIPFFLFAPALTSLSGTVSAKLNHIYTDADIVYENGAVVRTSFVTTFGDAIAETAPELGRRIKETQKRRLKAEKPTLPKYEYPIHVLTAAMMNKYAKYGVDFTVARNECVRIPALDSQRPHKKTIFGSGLLLSDDAAARHEAAQQAAAQQAAAQRWGISERERLIIEQINKQAAKERLF